MKRLASAMSAALAFSFLAGAYAPAMAAPVIPAPMVTSDANISLVQQRREIRRDLRELRQDRRELRQDRRELRRDRFERRGNSAYYNGQRGYRERRSGYRQYNGYWFPPAAFVLGAIVGGSVSRDVNVGSAHVRWCTDRWRSYRAYDNSYQPNSGARRTCVSPYS